MPLDSGQPSQPEVSLDTKKTPRRRYRSKKKLQGAQSEAPRVEPQHVSADQSHTVKAKAKTGAYQAKPAHQNSKNKTAFYQRPSQRGVYSAIDLGTNNCRLLIARPTYAGFRVIDAFSRVVRLGEGLSQTSRLSEQAIERTIEALKVCAEKIERRQVTCMRHVATEACRVAENSDEFLARVHEETGLRLDIISAGEEAKLAVMGCQSLIAPGNRNALVFDIGGGSTELIWVHMHPGGTVEIAGWMSIPWGVVNLSECFNGDAVESDKIMPYQQYENMVKTVTGHLQRFEDKYKIAKVVGRRSTQFLGTSGTVTTLASLHLKLPRYNREKVDGAWMRSGDIQELSRSVAGMSYSERAAIGCIGEERADLVVAGCAILEAILGMWKVPSLRVADRGIREGILRGMMQLENISGNRQKRFERTKNPSANHQHRTGNNKNV